MHKRDYLARRLMETSGELQWKIGTTVAIRKLEDEVRRLRVALTIAFLAIAVLALTIAVGR